MMLEFHILKNYPPVNLNRDDSGAPKTCFFGGVQRGRVSSQCLKRTWRTSDLFKALGSYGIRTRYMPEMVIGKLRDMGVEEAYLPIAEKMLTGVANRDGKVNSKGNYTTQIVFYAPEDIQRLAEAVKEAVAAAGSVDGFKKLKSKDFVNMVSDAKMRPVTADIALFGRMVTSDCFADVEAAMQVAHAISTHAVNRESDYFTAVDDLLNDRDENGAGMMGDTDYNSCCYYEYASLDLQQLRDNLRFCEDADSIVSRIVPMLLRVMVYTNPSGKQNTFAGQVLPSMILVECKKDMIPLSYVNAFEEPVSLFDGSSTLVEKSITRLLKEVKLMDDTYGLNVEHRAWMSPRWNMATDTRGDCARSFGELSGMVSSWLEEDRA